MGTKPHIELGVIQQRKSQKGEVVVRLNRELAQQMASPEEVYIQFGHVQVPYRVEKFILNYPKAIIKLLGVDETKAAYELGNRLVFAPECIPLPESVEEEKPASWIGYQVIDLREGILGTVKAIYTNSHQTLLAVDYCDRELLIPYHRDLIVNVDHTYRNIASRLPGGFTEMSV